MGASKAKRYAFFKNNPHCCFCGGAEIAVEEDHVPGRQFFRRRDITTSEFVFPACSKCNQGTRLSELVSACIFRMRPEELDGLEQREVFDMLVGIRNNTPATYRELAFAQPASRQIRRRITEKIGSNEVNVRRMGQNSKAHLERFSAKLALAFHYKFVGRPLPLGGYVYLNLRNRLHFLLGAAFPAEIPFGLISMLEQGKKTSAGQFEFRHALGEDFEGGAFQANFNNNWVITMVTSASSEFLVEQSQAMKVFRPQDGWMISEVENPWSSGSRESYIWNYVKDHSLFVS